MGSFPWWGRLLCAFLVPPAFLCSATPTAPTLRLPGSIAPTSYQVALTLDPSKPRFSGTISIKLEVKESVDTLWLNGNNIVVDKASLTTGTKSLVARVLPGGSDFLGLQFDSPLPVGPAEVRITYRGNVRQKDSSGIFRMEDNGNQYLYTQFENTDARAAFPCFDEPSYKVPWQLTLDVPGSETAISNTSPVKEETQGDRKVYTFGQTKPLPSYLVAFAVGQFDFVDAGRAGKNHVPIRIVTPKGHAAEAKYAAEVTATIINRLEDYFGIPFPYEKSDQLAIPVTFGFGAMENAGLVTYAQNIILAKPDKDTEMRRREYASVAAHELAHQWFGDLVTTAWWNDIWLNEAFATWMEQKILQEWKPEWKTRSEDVSSKLRVEAQDSLVSARKIRQEIESKNDISNAFDDITYEKGAAVIGMFENWVGSEQFRAGVQSYLKRYAFRTATAPEFLDSISSASGKNISQSFSSFLNQAGVPLISLSLDCNGSHATVHLEQSRSLPLGSKGSTEQIWQAPVCVRYEVDGKEQRQCSMLTEKKADWQLEASGCPNFVLGNDQAHGYYQVDYRGNLLPSLTANAEKHLSAPERVDFVGNVELLASAGKTSVADALGLVNTFASDPDRHVTESALRLALSPASYLVPQNLRPNYQHFLQKDFDERARALGWTPRSDEGDDQKLLRPTLVPAIATTGGDQELARQAQTLADKWLNDRGSLEPSIAGAVLRVAAYYGDKSFFDHLLAALNKTQDRQERARILSAMASFRDRAALEAGMEAVVKGQIPMIEGAMLLFAGQQSPATRTLAFDFLRSHFDEIANKRPTGGGFDFGSEFPRAGAYFCDAQSRDALKDYFEPRVQRFTGAPRTLSQTVESINVCIAEKQAQEPGVVAFLSKY